jgi:6-pyruvoyltetrahydropterin/6-carboxytetrahydropterin synthase
VFYSTKTYGHEQGLSACFRQHRAKSHCNQLHGYALSIKIIFGCKALDSRDWVLDFGALKPVKEKLVQLYDHVTVVCRDDPELEEFARMSLLGMLTMRTASGVGCEYFAYEVFDMVDDWLPLYRNALKADGITPPVDLHVVSVEVREHGANSAIYQEPYRPRGHEMIEDLDYETQGRRHFAAARSPA